MDYRKTNVESLDKLNQYFGSLGFKYQLVMMGGDRMCFVGNDRFGNATQWFDNNFPKSLLKKITYADWVDILLSVANSEWFFNAKK